MIFSNPGQCHFQFSLVDLDDASAAYDCENGVKLFLVDSLGWELDMPRVIKFYVLTAILLYKQGIEWMESIINMQKPHKIDSICAVIPTTILDDLMKFKMYVLKVTIPQNNKFDCGIFVIIQMYRLNCYLYGDNNVTTYQRGHSLSKDNVIECLNLRIVMKNNTTTNVRPISQKHVNSWRICEFLFLLSLWVRKLNKLGLAGVNRLVEDPFASEADVPYLAVNVGKHKRIIRCVDYNKATITIHNARKKPVIVEWGDFTFVKSPPWSEMVHIILKEHPQHQPSTHDLSRMYPGHKDDKDKYISGGYIIWKSCAQDVYGKEHNIKDQGLAVNSFIVKAAEILFKKRKKCDSDIVNVDDLNDTKAETNAKVEQKVEQKAEQKAGEAETKL